MLAKIQQQIMEKGKYKHVKQGTSKPNSVSHRESLHSQPQLLHCGKRQIRDFRRSNNLCYFYGEKFDAYHLQKCTKRNKPQLHALVVNDLDVPLIEETLNQLENEDVLTSEMGQLSLNAISGTASKDCMRIRALVHNKVMLILVDSGSSLSFVSQSFLLQTGIIVEPTYPITVRVANGDTLMSNSKVSALE
jgi:hypothetical protein